VRAILLLPAVALSVRVLGFRRTHAALERRAPPLEDGLPEPEVSERVWWARRLLQLALRWGPYRPNCLQRSLVLWWLLRQQGLGSEFRIGARLRGGVFEAHAWVERAGRVLNDRQDVGEAYAPFRYDFAPERLVFD
jgi:hypothetical protein